MRARWIAWLPMVGTFTFVAHTAIGSSYIVAPSYPTGYQPGGCLLADVDGDENLDLVITPWGEPRLYIHRGRGDATFEAASTMELPGPPSMAIADDLDRDGDVDLTVAMLHPAGGIRLLDNDGGGRFTPRLDVLVGHPVPFVAQHDWSGDGHLDLVAQTIDGDGVIALMSNGAGGFGPGKFHHMGSVLSIAAFDIDADVDLDIAVGGPCRAVWTIRNSGVGSFGTLVGFGVQHDARFVISGNFRGGVEWLVASGGDRVSFLEARDGRMRVVQECPVTMGGSASTTGDFDGDGDLDVAVSVPERNHIDLLLNRGDGTFQTAYGFGVDEHPIRIAAGDLDRDGAMEIVSANLGSHTFSVLRRGVDGLVESRRNYPNFGGGKPVTKDLNGDGRLDLATIASGSVSILLQERHPLFGWPRLYSLGLEPSGLASADFDRDGVPDLAAISQYGGVAVLSGNGDGTFEAPKRCPAGFEPFDIVAGDLDADGWADLAIADHAQTSPGAIQVLYNDRSGGFDPPVALRTLGTAPVTVAIADVDQDGDDDVITANYEQGGVCIFQNSGGRRFSLRYFNAAPGIWHVTTAHWFGGRAPDIVLVNRASARVTVLRNDGGGAFPFAIHYAASPQPVHVAIEDLDGDDRLDMAVARATANEVLVLYRGLGDAFVSTESYRVGAHHAVTAGFYSPDASDPELCVVLPDAIGLLSRKAQPFPPVTAEPRNVVQTRVRWLRNPTPRPASIVLDLPQTTAVTVSILDIQGRRIRTLERAALPPGEHRLVWDGSSDDGRRAAPGVYFCAIESDGKRAAARGVLLE